MLGANRLIKGVSVVGLLFLLAPEGTFALSLCGSGRRACTDECLYVPDHRLCKTDCREAYRRCRDNAWCWAHAGPGYGNNVRGGALNRSTRRAPATLPQVWSTPLPAGSYSPAVPLGSSKKSLPGCGTFSFGPTWAC